MKNCISKVAIAALIAGSLLALPAKADSNIVNEGYYPIVYATRAIRAGSFITQVADIGVAHVPRDESYLQSALSPREILGFKTKRALRKNQIISMLDLAPNTRVKLPGISQAKITELEYRPLAYATKNIAVGTVIASHSDLNVIERSKKEANSGSVFSPLEILGYKTKVDLQKNQIISYGDIDFNSRINGFRNLTEALNFTEQLGIARKKWNSPSDHYWELCVPGRSQLHSQAGGVVIATRNIPKDSFILEAADVELLMVPQSHIPAGALVSPFRAIGGKTKYAISKNEMICMYELDFSAPLSKSQRQLIKEKYRIAGKKWTGLSVDDFTRGDRVLNLK
jgi:flagella basal body P-ring formation protein FlgA